MSCWFIRPANCFFHPVRSLPCLCHICVLCRHLIIVSYVLLLTALCFIQPRASRALRDCLSNPPALLFNPGPSSSKAPSTLYHSLSNAAQHARSLFQPTSIMLFQPPSPSVWGRPVFLFHPIPLFREPRLYPAHSDLAFRLRFLPMVFSTPQLCNSNPGLLPVFPTLLPFFYPAFSLYLSTLPGCLSNPGLGLSIPFGSGAKGLFHLPPWSFETLTHPASLSFQPSVGIFKPHCTSRCLFSNL